MARASAPELPAELNELTRETIAAAIEVHRRLGPGLLERLYQDALAIELRRRGLTVEREVPVQATYRGEDLGHPLRIDLLVGGKLIIEVKAVEAVHRVHKVQLLTYLRLANKRVGLLLNFNGVRLTDGLHRVVNPPPSDLDP